MILKHLLIVALSFVITSCGTMKSGALKYQRVAHHKAQKNVEVLDQLAESIEENQTKIIALSTNTEQNKSGEEGVIESIENTTESIDVKVVENNQMNQVTHHYQALNVNARLRSSKSEHEVSMKDKKEPKKPRVKKPYQVFFGTVGTVLLLSAELFILGAAVILLTMVENQIFIALAVIAGALLLYLVIVSFIFLLQKIYRRDTENLEEKKKKVFKVVAISLFSFIGLSGLLWVVALVGSAFS